MVNGEWKNNNSLFAIRPYTLVMSYCAFWPVP